MSVLLTMAGVVTRVPMEKAPLSAAAPVGLTWGVTPGHVWVREFVYSAGMECVVFFCMTLTTHHNY